MPADESRLMARLGPMGPRLIVLFHESWKYLAVSVVALAIDFALLVSLTQWAGLKPLVSSAIGFCVGLVVSYILSITLVFTERRLSNRWFEFGGFLLIGAVGLAINQVSMKFFIDSVGLGYALAKLPTTGVSFVFNFVARRMLLFTARP